MTEKHKKSLEIFAKYMIETSNEELEKDFVEVETLEFEGPTLEDMEYLLVQENIYSHSSQVEVYTSTTEITDGLNFTKTVCEEIIIKNIAISSGFTNAPLNSEPSIFFSMNMVKIGLAA